jgi:hypothetical protein
VQCFAQAMLTMFCSRGAYNGFKVGDMTLRVSGRNNRKMFYEFC